MCHKIIGAIGFLRQSVSLATVPFSSDFGDLETKVHGVEVGGLPFEDVVTPSRLVPLWRNPNPNKITMWQTLWNKNT